MNDPGAPSGARIEHLGMTVPDIEAATEFFEQAFGAEIMFEMVTAEAMDDPAVRAVMENFDLAPALGVPPGTEIKAIRLLMVGESLMVELFEWNVEGEQRPPVVPTDFGLQHACIYVDDIDATAERFERAGGTLFDGPVPLFGPPHYEGGFGRYSRTPWGTTIELMSYPSAPPPARS